ncbi:MAG: hypothetical protein ACHQHM_01710 [Thermoanaerobaculales bacterium]
MRSERRLWRLFLYSAWVLFSSFLALIAGAGLVGGILNSGYDSHENRAPEVRIAVAAVATAVGLAAVTVAAKRLRGGEGRRGLLTGLCLTAATVMLIALLGIVDLASGPM